MYILLYDFDLVLSRCQPISVSFGGLHPLLEVAQKSLEERSLNEAQDMYSSER